MVGTPVAAFTGASVVNLVGTAVAAFTGASVGTAVAAFTGASVGAWLGSVVSGDSVGILVAVWIVD